LTTVKSRINPRIRRKSNGPFVLYNDHIFIEFSFVRHIFAMIWDMRYSRFACFANVDLVEQNDPLHPELNRLGLGRFSW